MANKIKILPIIFLLMLLNSCTFKRTTNLIIDGQDIRSVYGRGDASVLYQSNTEIGLFYVR